MHSLDNKLELLRLKAAVAKETEAALNDAIIRIGVSEDMMVAAVMRLGQIVRIWIGRVAAFLQPPTKRILGTEIIGGRVQNALRRS